jgi:DNA-binding CsgD family transcriptional regulator
MSEGRISTPARDELTPRQREVMELIAAGKTNFEIAQHLGVSLEGAKYHVSEILAKLQVDSREEAVAAWESTSRRLRWPKWRILVPAAAGVGTIAAALAVVGAFVSPEPRSTDGQAALAGQSPDPSTWCRSWESRLVPLADSAGRRFLDYQLRSAEGEPCYTFGGFSIVPYSLVDPVAPLDAQIDRQGSAAEFQADLTAEFQTVARFQWSNWCQDPRPVFFIVLGGPNAGRGDGNPVVLTDQVPSCEQGGRAGFHHVPGPHLQLEELEPPLTCLPEDLRFDARAEPPWELGRSASFIVEIWSERPCTAGPTMTLNIVGTQAVVEVPLSVTLGPDRLGIPFRWDNWCEDSATFLVSVGNAREELTTDVVPHCRTAATGVSLGSGWP